MHTAAGTRFPEGMRLRLPRGMVAALATAARRKHTSASEWARQVLIQRLEQEGVGLRCDADDDDAV